MRHPARLTLTALILATACGCAEGVTSRPAAGVTAEKRDTAAAGGAAAGWTDARHSAARVGDVRVTVKGVAVGNVPLEMPLGGRTESEKPFVVVRLELANLHKTRKVDYRSWQANPFVTDARSAVLADDLGNRYRAANFGAAAEVVGRVAGASVYPGESVADVLAFERPVDAAKELYLTLPAQAFGGEPRATGPVRFRFPAGGF